MKISASTQTVAPHSGNSVHAIESKMHEIKKRIQEIQEKDGPSQQQIIDAYRTQMMTLKELLMERQYKGKTPSIPRLPAVTPTSNTDNSKDINPTGNISLYI